MSNSLIRTFANAVLVSCVAVLISSNASASLELNLDTGSGYVLVDSDASGGVVTFSGTQGGVDFQLISGSSNSPGGAPQSELNISSLKITNNNAFDATIKVLVGDVGFTFPGVGPIQLTSSIGGTVTTSVVKSISYQTWVDDTNTQNGMAGITSGLLSQDTSGISNGNPIAQMGNSVGGAIGTSPYSMTGLVTLVLAAGASANFATSAVATVPEATSLLVWAGLGLVSLAAGRRNRV